MTDHYDLFKATDEHITRPRFKAARSSGFYPSEASVQAYDEHGDLVTYGGCLRASYFRCSGKFTGIPHDAHTQFIFTMGNAVESILVNQWKEMGVWVDNNVKFYDKENNISGELDAILMEPPDGKLYGVEVKSFYGYFAERELFGNRNIKAFPKMGQLLQTLIYVNHFREQLPYFRMVYFGRDSVKRRTFLVELETENGLDYPKVEGEVVRQFTIQDILARYKSLQSHIDADSPPPADFELHYSDAKIKDYFEKGKVAKTNYEKWKNGKLKKNEAIGDWQCRYCKYKNECWG